MKYLTALAICLVYCNPMIAQDIKRAVIGVSIVAVQPDGTGNRCVIPFRYDFGDSGLRRWEIITEPFLAKGEDGTEQDINLFSLCKIKITAIRPSQKPAHIEIDFSKFAVPDVVKISKKEIVSSLFTCINDTTFPSFESQPVVSLVTTNENKEIVENAKAEYLRSKPPDAGWHLGAEVGTVWLRVRNGTGVDLKAVKLQKQYSYGDLKNGAVSDYQKVGGLYSNAYAEAFSGKRKLICQPIDFVGESPLNPGYYTDTLTEIGGDHLDMQCNSDPEPTATPAKPK